MSDPEKDKTMVASLLELKKQIDVLHANAFMSNDDFKRSIKVRRQRVGEQTVSGLPRTLALIHRRPSLYPVTERV